jgi:two-component system, NtrC family, sensor histidine kinase HydH
MNHRIAWRISAPAIVVGLLLFASCLAGVWYINRLQRNLADILSRNVASLQAAQELEIRVRQLRHHSLLYLMDPSAARLEPVTSDEQQFEAAMDVARRANRTPEEEHWVEAIKTNYDRYHEEQARLRASAKPRPTQEFLELLDTHPIRQVVVPCQELLQVNKLQMAQLAEESRRVSQHGSVAMLLLGLAGPVGGLAVGYGVARGLSRSIYRLSVRVQDMAQHLDRDVASVSVTADGDLSALDRQMEYIVGRVEEAAARLRQQQRELFRADQLAAVGQLAASVAHEIRNPLTGIKMLVEAAMRARNPSPLNSEDLHVIHTEVVRLEKTVQGLLNFARLPAPRREICDIREIIGQACDLVRARARERDIAVNVQMPDRAVPGFVDSDQLCTVLVNLFLNAIDAMPRGGRIEVKLESETASGVRLSISDTGEGIPQQIVERLFMPFASTKPTGTGLGLSISRRILEEHGGAIAGSNRPEGGAEFVIHLPEPEGVHGDRTNHRR